MTSPPIEGIRPFAEFLQETSNGTTHDELSIDLHELIRAVREHGKKGSLTLTITVAPLSKRDDSQLTVTEEIKVAAPKPEPRPSIYFADRNGNLSRTDPAQLAMDLRELPTPPAPREIP